MADSTVYRTGVVVLPGLEFSAVLCEAFRIFSAFVSETQGTTAEERGGFRRGRRENANSYVRFLQRSKALHPPQLKRNF